MYVNLKPSAVRSLPRQFADKRQEPVRLRMLEEQGQRRLLEINVRARHIYKKCGFAYVSPLQSREVDMSCDVTAQRDQIAQRIVEIGRGRARPITFAPPAAPHVFADLMHASD